MTSGNLGAPDLDLDLTFGCGQVFHWTQAPDRTWEGLVGNQFVHLRAMDRGKVRFSGADRETLARYLALDHDLPKILESFPKDAYSAEAVQACRGLRILRQPEWECLATFITSAMKQVAHIRQISWELRQRFGKPVPGSSWNAYPAPEVLAQQSEQALRDCGLGFRGPNLLRAAHLVASGAVDLTALHALPTEEAREALQQLPGVGRKVANCVLLFAYERLEVVPVDVWVGRIVRGFRRRRGTNLALENYSHRRFGVYAGYVQQYLFHYARTSKKLPSP